MTRTDARLPQLEGGWFLTDAGLETVLIFQEGVTLPEFAAFVLLRSQEGRDQLRRYFRPLPRARRGAARCRIRAREPDVARRLGLGHEARLRRRVRCSK